MKLSKCEAVEVGNLNKRTLHNPDALRTSRPSLSKKCREERDQTVTSEDFKQLNDDASVKKSFGWLPVNGSTTRMSSRSPNTSCLTNSSLKMSVNKVKEICTYHGWKLEGSQSTRKGREGGCAVHFYKVCVHCSKEKAVVARGVGGEKVEAVKRAFKTIEHMLKEKEKLRSG